MPEYPEVKTYAESLCGLIADRTITAAFGVPAAAEGERIVRVDSHGKRMRFVLGGGGFTVHLMLTGEFYYEPTACARERDHTVMRLEFGDDALTLSDVNRFARVTADWDASVPEPERTQLTEDYFRKAMRSGRAVKTVLTDQTVISGIGNAYADEILYEAGIHPKSICREIPAEILRALYEAVIGVMAYACGAFSARFPGAIRGEERSWLKVHVKGRKTTDRGEKIETTSVSGRKSYYADSQRLYA